MRHIASTTGTSIAQGVAPLNDPRERPAYAAAIRARCERLRTNDAATFLARVSAETNSLARLGITPADRLLLLHSDTIDGEICAELVADLLRQGFGATVTLARTDGLQVTDATRFRTVGVPSLFRHLDRFAGAAGDDSELLLNITGGFKSVVPYVTLYGLLQRHRVVYLFERSEELIELPPAPLDFDWDRLGRIAPALRALKEAGVMTMRISSPSPPASPWTTATPSRHCWRSMMAWWHPRP
jgi:putative CRISPR-associated protein (TIGR02619 family)